MIPLLPSINFFMLYNVNISSVPEATPVAAISSPVCIIRYILIFDLFIIIKICQLGINYLLLKQIICLDDTTSNQVVSKLKSILNGTASLPLYTQFLSRSSHADPLILAKSKVGIYGMDILSVSGDLRNYKLAL